MEKGYELTHIAQAAAPLSFVLLWSIISVILRRRAARLTSHLSVLLSNQAFISNLLDPALWINHLFNMPRCFPADLNGLRTQ